MSMSFLPLISTLQDIDAIVVESRVCVIEHTRLKRDTVDIMIEIDGYRARRGARRGCLVIATSGNKRGRGHQHRGKQSCERCPGTPFHTVSSIEKEVNRWGQERGNQTLTM